MKLNDYYYLTWKNNYISVNELERSSANYSKTFLENEKI